MCIVDVEKYITRKKILLKMRKTCYDEGRFVYPVNYTKNISNQRRTNELQTGCQVNQIKHVIHFD